MSTVTRPRGRHPAQVYWVRRGLVLLTALFLVVAFARLLGGSGGAAPEAADQVAAKPTSTPSTTAPAPIGPVGVTTGAPAGTPTGNPPPVLAQPDGPCDPEDITVTPVITTAPAGAPVPIAMQLTGIKPACTFTVSAQSLAARVTHSGTRIWTTQQCPLAITHRTLVVRSAQPVSINVRWSGRHSDRGCTRSGAWALPGKYVVTAAVIGSEPADQAFVLTSPPRPIVTRTVTVKPKPITKTPTSTPTATGKVD